MRRRRSSPKDSLDLLLDTICNAFGGIVLIAILIALLTRQAARQAEPVAAGQDRDVVEQQIAQSQREIQGLQEHLAAMADPADEAAALAAAERRLAAAREENARAWSTWEQAARKAGGDDPEAARLLTQQAEMARRLAKAESEEAAARAALELIQGRVAGLGEKLQQEITARAEKLRLPLESTKDLGAFPIILRHNEVFPLQVFREGALVENREALAWKDVNDEDCIVTPKAGRGIKPGELTESLRRTLLRLKGQEVYVSLYVYADSAGAYRAVVQELVAAGLVFGWEPAQQESIRFTSGDDGSSPPPL